MQQCCTTASEAPYECCDSEMNGTLSGGVLAVGSKVWTADNRDVGQDRALLAFVQEIGFVRLNGRALRCREMNKA